MREETLRALVSARETLSNRMREAAEGTRSLRESMAETVASSASLTGMINTTEGQTEEYDRAIRQLGRDSVQAAVKQEFLAENYRNAGTKAWFASGAVREYTRNVDESGDEATEAAMQNAGLAAAFRGVGAAAGEASVNVGPFNTSVRRAVVALPALIGLVGSLYTALGGLTVAAGGAAGALAALFAGGLVGRAEAMAAASSDLENRGEALMEIMRQVGGAIDDATEPIQQLGQQRASMDVLRGLVTLAGDLAQSAARLDSVFGDVADRLGPAFWAEEARGIAELEAAIVGLMPILEDIAFYILTELPDLLAWLRQETLRVGPAMGDFVTSLIPVIRELTEIGNTLFRLTLPALSLLLDTVTVVLGVFEEIPDALIVASVAFGVISAALTTYAGSAGLATAATSALWVALSPLIGAYTTLAGAMGASIAIYAGVAAAVAGAITYFGWWDDILRGLIGTWNLIVEIVEFAINSFIWLKKTLTNVLGPLVYLIPILGQIYFAIDLIVGIIDVAVWAFKELGDFFGWLGKQYEKYIEPIIEGLVDVAEKSNEAAEAAGGVDLSEARMGTPSAAAEGGPSRGRTGDESQEGRREQARQYANRGADSGVKNQSEQIQREHTENNFDFSGATFGSGLSDRDIERIVERVVNDPQSSDM